ncbi:MAG: hypothetical protein ACE15C_11500 [Phycisphaerae bacterium]
MPIISKIGARSFKIRMVYFTIFLVLTVGALTMIYPFLLMISGSFSSEADSVYITPYPRFWAEDGILYQKYVESKYNDSVQGCEVAWDRPIGSWRQVKPPGGDAPYLAEYLEWRKDCRWWSLGHTAVGRLYPINGRLWREKMYSQFNGDINAYRDAYGIPVKSWHAVKPPPDSAVRFPMTDEHRKAFHEFAAGRPVCDRIIANLDGSYWRNYLQPKYTSDIKEFNLLHATSYKSYEDAYLDGRIPGTPAADRDWEEFVSAQVRTTTAPGASTEMGGGEEKKTGGVEEGRMGGKTTTGQSSSPPVLSPSRPSEHPPASAAKFVKADAVKPNARNLPGFREFLKGQFKGDIKALNEKCETRFKSFEDITFGDTEHSLKPAARNVKAYQDYLRRTYRDRDGKGDIAAVNAKARDLHAKAVELQKLIKDGKAGDRKLSDHDAILITHDQAEFEAFEDVNFDNTAEEMYRDAYEVVPFIDVLREQWLTYQPQVFRAFLAQRYGNDVGRLNAAWKTKYAAFVDAPYLAVAREDWQEFVREQIQVTYLRMDADLAGSFRAFLNSPACYEKIEDLNKNYSSSFKSFDEVPFPATMPATRIEQVDWDKFLRDRKACPAEKIAVYGPRQAFQDYLVGLGRAYRGEVLDGPVRIPIEAADYRDMTANKSDIRWEMTRRNYLHVWEYIALHGRGLMNTVIYVVLAIATALLVNPLAAYALSRYKLRSTYKILLFCMATMAFPGEVTMIPAFLLMRRFPLWPLVGGTAVFIVVLWLMGKLAPRLNELLRMLVSLMAGVVAGYWGVPLVMGKPDVSLLNTFSALVLPGMADGFSIFLLKGFFDSLPRELFEAADIDGAGEWTKFWSISMNLSKPILAVIALGAFTGAYSAFMMALIIIPDQAMWTLMVWIFQLQSQSHQAVVYASLVIAALPTLLVFALCQNIIIRGIVVPTEK